MSTPKPPAPEPGRIEEKFVFGFTARDVGGIVGACVTLFLAGLAIATVWGIWYKLFWQGWVMGGG